MLSLSLFTHLNSAIAQESDDASAEAAADGDSQSAEAAADADTGDANVEADAQATSGEDTSAQVEASADNNSATTSDNDSADADTSADTAAPTNSSNDNSGQTSQEESAAVPPPSNPNSGNAAPSTQPSNSDRKQSSDARAPSDRNRTDANVQGRANVNARSDGDRQRDMRRGIRFDRGSDRGLSVNQVERNSWYYNSGFRQGDVIVSVQGRPVRSDADFWRFVVVQPGQRVPVVVMRGRQRETIYVEYRDDVVHAHHYEQRPAATGGAYLGVIFQAEARNAAVVKSVNPGSPAQEAGLQAGDIVLALNGQEVRSYTDAISLIRSMRPGDELEIVIERSRNEQQIVAMLERQPNVQTARRTDVNVERTTVEQPANVEVEVDSRDDDGRLLNRNRSGDGNSGRGLLPGRRN